MTTPEGPQSPGTEATLQQKFFRYFQHEVTALQDQMDRLGDRPSIAGERADAADHCLAGISRLSSEVKDASTYLPPYDQRTYAEAIKALQDKLQDTRATFAPKQKFSFKSARKSPSAVSLSDAAELAAQKRRGIPGYLSPSANTPDSTLSNTPGYLQTPPNERSTINRPVPDTALPSSLQQSTTTAQISNDSDSSNDTSDVQHAPVSKTSNSTSTSVNITDQSRAHIILPATTSAPNTPCSISGLTSCVLDLSIPSPSTYASTAAFQNPFASLTINNINSSLLYAGTVNGPAHITNLCNSVLVITCRQLRMHDCENVDVYLHCTSRPIIESCKGVRFTTLPQTYIDLLNLASPDTGSREAEGQEPNTVTKLHDSPNLYDQIDDFKWLKSQPSPNWSIMKEADRVPEEVWRDVVPGGPGWSVEDILKGVGVGDAR